MNDDTDIRQFGWHAVASNGKEYGKMVAVAGGESISLEFIWPLVQHNLTDSLNKLHKEGGLTFHSLWIGEGPEMPRLTEEEMEE